MPTIITVLILALFSFMTISYQTQQIKLLSLEPGSTKQAMV